MSIFLLFYLKVGRSLAGRDAMGRGRTVGRHRIYDGIWMGGLNVCGRGKAGRVLIMSCGDTEIRRELIRGVEGREDVRALKIILGR